MKKNRKIGFHSSDDEEELQEEKSIHPFQTYIEENYKPNGFAEEMELITTLELVYAVSEMFTVLPYRVVDILTELHFEMKNIEGEVTWVLYKNP